MANTINFKGIKQVTLAKFTATADADKLGYLWLVREPKSESPADGGKKVDSFSIYFGTRRYAENDVFFHENLIKTFGGLLDSEGGFIFPVTGKEFTSIEQSKISDLNGLLLALDAVIKANKDAISEAQATLATKADATAVSKNIATAKQEAIDAAGSAVDEKLKDYATTTAVEEKISAATKTLEYQIANAGSVKDVTVDGASVLDTEDKVAKIVLPVYGLKKVNDLTYQLTKKVGDAEAEAVDGAVINIPQDQFLKNVSFHSTKEEGAPEDVKAPYLKFEWNLDTDTATEGDQTVTYVPVADLVKTYTAGTAIEITAENGINVKVAENSETNKNFLTVESSGLAVRGMDADKTVLTEKIPVAGGPLASLLNEAGIKELDPNMSIADILVKMVAKEIYPTPTYTNAAIKASVAAPAISANVANNATVEVGTEFTLNDVTSKTISVSTTAAAVGNLLYGYSAENDNKADTTAKTISASVTTGISDNTYTLSAAVSGFNANGQATTPATVSGADSVTMPSVNIGAVAEGSNKVTITEKGAIATGSTQAINPVFVVSNFGKTSDERKTTEIAAASVSASAPTNSASITVNGAYKYFLGYSEKTKVEEFDSSSIRALTVNSGWVTKDGATTIVGDTAIESDGRSIIIACPKKYKLSKINNGVGANILGNFDTTGVINVSTGEINTEYNVYIYPITNNAPVEFKNVALSKA